MTPPQIPPPASVGVELLGTGSALPERRLTNADLEKVMDTSDEWIVQRTGIRERRVHDPEKETTADIASAALNAALQDAGIAADELDFLLCATMTPDCPTPATSCVVANRVGAGPIGAYDLNAACSGFVFAMNTAHDLIRGGAYRTVAVIGADLITRFCDYSTYGRGAAILFGDGAGAAIIRATSDTTKGLLAQAMHSDAGRAKHLFIPANRCDFYNDDDFDERKIERIQMNGPAVFKFAVSTFPDLIQETLDKASLSADQVDHYLCHQSNLRILEAARNRFGIPEEKLYVNIDRCGNTVAASVPLILDELRKADRIHEGQRIMLLGFGAGLTWGSSLWQV